MTEIQTPQAPGFFVSKWREEGPVDLETATKWRDEMGWSDWLQLAEAAFFLDAAELLDLINDEMTPAQQATFALVRRRALGDNRLDQAIEDALQICRSPETRDLKLEGRLRMERGLQRFEGGDSEGAEEDLTWAETRLKSVAKASRDHDLSLLNKAAYHLAVGEYLMALQVYGDISRKSGHADETIAISRLGASRIHSALGHDADAVRHAWNAHHHALKASQIGMAMESGALFIDFASAFVSEDAERMAVQVENSQPKEMGEPMPIPQVHPEDINGVFSWCMSQLTEDYSGEDRPDLRAMLSLGQRLGKLELFTGLLSDSQAVEDPMLAAICMNCVDDEILVKAWNDRLATLTNLSQ